MKTVLAAVTILLAGIGTAWSQTARTCEGGADTTGGCVMKRVTEPDLRIDRTTTAAIPHSSGARAAAPRVIPSAGGGFDDQPIGSGNALTGSQGGSISGSSSPSIQ
jgi:hypothetical protein